MAILIIVVVLLASWFMFTALGQWIAEEKGRNVVEGLLLGACLGLFGVLIEALLPSKGPTQVMGAARRYRKRDR